MAERGESVKRNKYAEKERMTLPEGKTCGDCWHYARCEMLFGCNKANEVCDWSPARFREPKGGES